MCDIEKPIEYMYVRKKSITKMLPPTNIEIYKPIW